MKAAYLLAAGLALAASAGQALADYEKGTIIGRIGAGWVDPNDDSNWLRLDGTELPDSRIYVDTGESATITGSWLFADHWGLGLLVAFPFKHDLKISGLPNPNGGASLGRVNLGDIEHLPPTLTVQWFPVCVESWIQPYAGIGVNYTTFMDEDISRTANNYFMTVLGAQAGASLDLKDSWGLAGELGVDIALGRKSQWLFNAAVWYLDLDSRAKIRFPTVTGTTEIKTDLDIDPWVYSVGIGYRF
ncbi:OmpW/AlkL family protein [Microbulbifer marinus]|uniref:Outer membrane protein n=1 Tax=Microbulbifer marinus TaxID=658218 RepID=A0A1H4BDS7_9GAMM|nr:OmpW family outer membrane protein [Microbulbifer marinus]SEA46158.1 outer membrane protein [Microbulbifer marinus]